MATNGRGSQKPVGSSARVAEHDSHKQHVSWRVHNLESGAAFMNAACRMIWGGDFGELCEEYGLSGSEPDLPVEKLHDLDDVQRAAIEFCSRLVQECGHELPWSPALMRALAKANHELQKRIPDETVNGRRALAVGLVNEALRRIHEMDACVAMPHWESAPETPETRQARVKWEAEYLRSYLFALDPNFFDLDCGDVASDLGEWKHSGARLLARWVVHLHVDLLGFASDGFVYDENALDEDAIDRIRRQLDNAVTDHEKLLRGSLTSSTTEADPAGN